MISSRVLSGVVSALAVAAVGAGPAAADQPGSIGQVTINSGPTSVDQSCGNSATGATCYASQNGLKVVVGLTTVNRGQLRLNQLSVSNASTDGNLITDIQSNLSNSRLVVSTCQVSGQAGWSCLGGGTGFEADGFSGAAPGQGPTIQVLACTPNSRGCTGFTTGLSTVNVKFDDGTAGACSNGAADVGAGPAARVADNCTPPSGTKITQAKINRNTAFFKFTARGASRFQCKLFRNRRVLFNRGCKSPKPYANALAPGHYAFVVWGVNRAGYDRKSAVKQFTIR
jgi:hypothetical protein